MVDPGLAALLGLTGVATGLLAGLLGVGGGVIIVPVLIEVYRALGLPPGPGALTAIGTSQAAMVVASSIAALAHRRGAGIDSRILRLWLVPVVMGSLAGIALARIVPASWLIGAFVVAALVMSAQLLGGGRWVMADRLPVGAVGAVLPFLVGGLAAAVGVGAGTLGVPALSLFGVPIHRSIGVASVLAALVAGLSMGGFVMLGWGVADRPGDAVGYVAFGTAALLSVGALIGTPAGAALARRLPVTALRHAFILVLWAVAARMASNLF